MKHTCALLGVLQDRVDGYQRNLEKLHSISKLKNLSVEEKLVYSSKFDQLSGRVAELTAIIELLMDSLNLDQPKYNIF